MISIYFSWFMVFVWTLLGVIPIFGAILDSKSSSLLLCLINFIIGSVLSFFVTYRHSYKYYEFCHTEAKERKEMYDSSNKVVALYMLVNISTLIIYFGGLSVVLTSNVFYKQYITCFLAGIFITSMSIIPAFLRGLKALREHQLI